MEFLKMGLLILFCLALSACVSVNLGPKSAEKSKGVEFSPPSTPFVALKDAHADGAWQNKHNGNSISYLSTCNDPSDPPLENVSRELFSDLKEVRLIGQNTRMYNAREALDEEVEGKVDGIATRIRSVIFKKNGCMYTLTFIGIPRAFESDRAVFEKFLKGFQAP